MIHSLKSSLFRIAMLLALVFAVLLFARGETARPLMAEQQQAIDQMTNHAFQTRLRAHFTGIVNVENASPEAKPTSTEYTEQPPRFHPYSRTEETNRATRRIWGNAYTKQKDQVLLKKFADDDKKQELESESFNIYFDQSERVFCVYRRDGNEVLALYTNGLPKNYSCHIESNLWYRAEWSESGEILSERTARQPRVIGRVGAR